MLYNQALLARCYLEYYQITKQQFYCEIAEQTLEYVLRELQNKQGGFYSATDADSESKEGTFFVWSITELQRILTKEEADFAIDFYGLTQAGNFEGKNILFIKESLTDYSHKNGLDELALVKLLQKIRLKLYNARQKRIKPFLDNKVLLSWNSLLLTSLILLFLSNLLNLKCLLPELKM